jgi:hypothetical protein
LPYFIYGASSYPSPGNVPYQVYNWGVNAPTTAPTLNTLIASGNLNGTYYYACTFLSNLTALESSASPFSAAITANGQQVTINLPTSSDSQTGWVNIYRFGGTLGGIPLYVASVTNGTSTYTDNTADSALTGSQLILRNDAAAPYSACEYHKTRMWLLGPGGSTESAGLAPNTIAFSNYNSPTQFNYITQVLQVSLKPNDYWMAMRSGTSVGFCWSRKALYAVYGETDQDFVLNKVADIGLQARTAVGTNYGLYSWLSDDGIYLMSEGGQPANISDGSGAGTANIRTFLSNRQRSAYMYTDPAPVTFFANRCVYYSFAGHYNITYVYDLVNQQWTSLPYATRAVEARTQISDLAQIANYEYATTPQPSLGVVAASETTSGAIELWFNTDATDLGTNVSSYWTGSVTDSGSLNLAKQYRYLLIEAPTQANTINVQLTIDPGTSPVVYGPYSCNLSTGGYRHFISLPPSCTGNEIQVQFSASTTSQLILNKIAVLGYVKRENTYQP